MIIGSFAKIIGFPQFGNFMAAITFQEVNNVEAIAGNVAFGPLDTAVWCDERLAFLQVVLGADEASFVANVKVERS